MWRRACWFVHIVIVFLLHIKYNQLVKNVIYSQGVEGRALVGVLGAKPPKNFDIYRQEDARCSNFKFNLNIFEEYFYVHFVIILVGIDATC